MQFSSNPAILGLVVILFICHIQISYSSNNKKKPPTRPSVTKKKNTNTGEIITGLTDLVDQNLSEGGVNILDIGFGVAEVVASLAPSPVGTLLSCGLTLFELSQGGKENPYNKVKEELEKYDNASQDRDKQTHSMLMEVYDAMEANENASRDRNLKTQKIILEESKRLEEIITYESSRVIKNLTKTFELRPFMKTMRKDLEYLVSVYSKNIVCILNSHCVVEPKRNALGTMMNSFSEYRTKLDRFISNYIEPEIRNLQKSYSEDLFFDFLLHEARERAAINKNCSPETFKSQIFKSYMFIAKILTDGYTIVAAAHAVRYREYSVEKNVTDIIATFVNETVKIANEYRNHMEILMQRTKMTLEETSGEIRKCDPDRFVEGESFESLEIFTTTLYRDRFTGKKYKNLWCYDPNGVEPEMFFPGVENYPSKEQRRHLGNCLFYKKLQKVGFSTYSVNARPGNVVTGIRWRIKNYIIYVDIQEGKFIDGTRVKRSTLEFRETPESDEHVVFFNENFRGILLEDVTLEPGTYVTGVQMTSVNGKLTLSVKGSGTNSQGTKLSGESFYVDAGKGEYSELFIDRLSNPVNLPSENEVEKSQGQYYVNLQLTDILKENSTKSIPYFDIQEIITNPPAPIGGLGIYYKAVKGYGGFVALRMISADYSHMFNEKHLEKYSEILKIKPKKGTKKN